MTARVCEEDRKQAVQRGHKGWKHAAVWEQRKIKGFVLVPQAKCLLASNPFVSPHLRCPP